LNSAIMKILCITHCMDTMHVHTGFCLDSTHGFLVRCKTTDFGSNVVSNLTFDNYWLWTIFQNFKNGEACL
jgi:hypothetical protein